LITSLPKPDSRILLSRLNHLLIVGALLSAFLLGFARQAEALKRQPGRPAGDGGKMPLFDFQSLDPNLVLGIEPGFFVLIPTGNTEENVQPALLYQDPAEALTSDLDFFAKRVEIPVGAVFQVMGGVAFIKSQETTVVFPELLLTEEAPGGGPDLKKIIFRRTEVAVEAGSDMLLDYFLDQPLVFQGPKALYLVVRFPPGSGTGALIQLDTDQDYGLYPGTNYLATGGLDFLSFEQAAETVRPAFFGLENRAPPGLAGDQLAMGLVIGMDPSTLPAYPPKILKISPQTAGDVTGTQGLGVRLEVFPYLADQLTSTDTPRRIVVTHLLPETFEDSLIAVVDLEPEGWIHVPGLENRTYLLRFFALDANSVAGLPSGAYFVLPADLNEPNDTRAEAAELEWSTPASGLWRESRIGPGAVEGPADFDFFRLELLAGDSLVAEHERAPASLSSFDAVLSLTDSSGLVLDHDMGAAASVALTAPYSGNYYLVVNDRTIFSGEAFVNQAGRVYELTARVLRRRGDMDGNGRLDYRDAFLVFVITSGLRDTLSFSPAQRFAADYDGDGQLVGDVADFLGVLGQTGYVAGRDPSQPSKSKNPGPTASLASTENWRLDFTDGSSLVLSLDQGVMQTAPGEQAASLLGLLQGLEPARTGVSPAPETKLPKAAGLSQNYPNPFNPSTAISFRLQRPGWVELEVFDTRGRLVRSLYRGLAPAAEQSVYWDGTDEVGRRVASGVYFYRLRAEELSLTRKMLLIK